MKKRGVAKSGGRMRIGFIGCGKMGGAILEALLEAKIARPADVRVCDAVPERIAQLEQSLRVRGAAAGPLAGDSVGST